MGNIKAFPVTEENENNALLKNQFMNLQKMHELKARICDLKMEVKSKNETIKSLEYQNEKLISVNYEQLSIQKQLELKLIEKQNEIRDIYNNQQELKLKLIEKENEICDIYNTRKEL